jgi:hypothetical protein
MSGHGHTIYGVAIQQAAVSGDLAKMREIRAQAEAHLANHGDVSAALEMLKAEIAKAEAKGG